MKSLNLSFVVFITLLLNLNAQQTGKVNYKGVEFTIPDGWLGNVTNDGFLMGSNTIPGFILLDVLPNVGVNEIKNEMENGINEGPNFNLIKEGEIDQLNQNALGCIFKGIMGYEQVKVYTIGKALSNNNGLVIFSGTSVEKYNQQYKNWALEIFKNSQLKVAQASQIKRNVSKNEWTDFYANTRLTYMDSYYSGGEFGGGYSNERTIDLCATGKFTMKSNFEMSGGGNAGSFIGTNRGNGQGTWDILPVSKTVATLVLIFSDGAVQKHNLTYDFEKGRTKLNGDRYYRTSAADGADYAPQCYE